MPDQPTAEDLRRQLRRRGVHLNTLHAAMRIGYLDERKRQYYREREQRIVKLVTMLGGLRAPDLHRIIGLTQPTIWRIVERLRVTGALRVDTTYRDHVPGRRAAWLQPPGSPDLSDEQRATLMDTMEYIRSYLPLWQIEQAQGRFRA
jgi:hypothetical protein